MAARLLLCLALLTSSGCAAMMSRQTCDITSNPPGAAVYLVDSPEQMSGGRFLVTTPSQKWIQQGLRTGYLRADLEGYESAVWPLPDSLRFSHHFELEPSVSARVAAEVARYPQAYVRAAVGVVGECEKVAASPSMLSGTTFAEANTANETLKLDFPELKSSVLAQALDETIDELRTAANVPPAEHAAFETTGATPRARYLIAQVKQALGVR